MDIRSNQEWNASTAKCQEVPHRPADAAVPLSFGQRQLWLLQQMTPHSPAYNVPSPLELQRAVDTAVLERAVNEIVRRHEALRTRFKVVDGQPVQVIAEELHIRLTRESLAHLATGERERVLRGRLEEEAGKPFDLEQLPLLRVYVFDLGAGGQVFLTVAHHIVWDGWSQNVFSRELAMLYEAYLQGKDSPLPELPRQYSDYAHWEAESARQGHLQEAIQYWKQQLAGVPQNLELPADFPRPIVSTFAGASSYFQINEAVTKSLKDLSRRSGATLYMTLLAAYALLLWRYSRQEQILIGTPSASRGYEELQGLIGFFANVLVMRVDLKGSLRFTDLLRQAKETALGAFAHQEVPFELLVEQLRPERNLSRTPLFQTMFVMQDSSRLRSGNGLLTGKPVEMNFLVAKFDLSLGMRELDGKLSAELNYNTALFTPRTIQRFQESFLHLLEELSKVPSLRLNDLAAVVTEAEWKEMQDWNSTRVEYGPEERLHVLFEKQVRSSPERLALVCDNEKLTYLELNSRANQLAHYLQKRGVGPESLVGVCMERSVEMVVALLGILKAGAAYLPLDPEYPSERLQWMQADACMPVALVQQKFAYLLEQRERTEVICLDSSGDFINQEPEGDCVSPVGGENVAYVIYTSGSTGRPKGVMNRHRGICNRLRWMQDRYRLDESDRVLQKTPYSFDVSVWEFFWPLITGACLIMARPGGHRDSSYLKRVIQRERITTIHFVPSMLKSMLEDQGLRECPALRRVICSGEALGAALIEQFHRECQAELHNLYGPTEAAVDVTNWACERHGARASVPIGRPIANIQIYLLDQDLMQVPISVPGELCIGGEGLSRGYLNRPDLTAEKFIPNLFGEKGSRLYRTGDLARYTHDGAIEYLGRIDFQVKIRGNRIEPAEIEEVLRQHEHVQDSAVIARQQPDGEKRLIAFVVAKKEANVAAQSLRAYLRERLPDFMVPGGFVFLEKLPLTSSGKLDRKALPMAESSVLLGLSQQAQIYLAPRNVLEKKIAEIWARVLRVEKVGVNNNFFDLGGHSLGLISVHSELREKLQIDVSVLDLFRLPTVASLANYLASTTTSSNVAARASELDSRPVVKETAIAIIGMAGRFPGAHNVEEFWENLKNGVESVSFFSDAELSDAPDALRGDPNYVRAAAVLEDADYFDAGFFGFRRREAETTDPQQRVFLECAWEVLERAGYDPSRYPAPIGVFAGIGASGHWFRLLKNPEVLQSVNSFQLSIGNDKDHLPLRVSYKLNLKGPSVNVQTACSTSLVAVHMACQSLLQGECKMVMAGGVSIRTTQKGGYLFQEGGITSPDGHCRTFDADAAGTVPGNGAGVVLLKRLKDALAEKDHIHAVILGSAINNDGAFKVGYTAPGVEGQAEVIAHAQARAGVPAESITYIEAHGTATPLGDPIEVAALTQAFRLQTARKQFCAVGSVKTNVGHLDAAAGVTGLIKAALAIQHGWLPPTLHFKRPNPNIDFSATPFYVNSELREWQCGPGPRRAGVSSFGIGGTNAHVVLEEPPRQEVEEQDVVPQLLLLSCKSEQALETATQHLGDHLKKHPEQRMCDVAFTLQEGRREFPFRRAIICQTRAQAIQAIESGDSDKMVSGDAEAATPPVYFLFPGQGAQYVNMARGLYESIPLFRRQIDRCAQTVRPFLGFNPLQLLYPEDSGGYQEKLSQTANAQPILFILEYAFASLWMDLGFQPKAMLGHSLGEYVAACLADVMSIEDALRLVAVRGKLMQNMPPGAMLSIPAPEHAVNELLNRNRDVALAAVNGPSLCVVSGPAEAILRFEAQLEEQGLEGHRLHTSHAFHSPMMAPVADALKHVLKEIKLRAPSIPFLSNLTGDWITPEQATSPDYWVDHLLHTVRFSDNLQRLLKEPQATLLEMGPETLVILARRHPNRHVQVKLVASMQSRGGKEAESLSFLRAVGSLWTYGNPVLWHILGQRDNCKRVALPTYPFERQRYNIPEVASDIEALAGVGRDQRPPGEPFKGAHFEQNENEKTVSMSPSCRLVFQQLEVVARQLELLRQRVQ